MILILRKVDPTLQPLFHYGCVYRTAHPPAGLGCPEPRISWSQKTVVVDHGSLAHLLREQSLRFVQRGDPLVAQLSVVDKRLGGTSHVAQ